MNARNIIKNIRKKQGLNQEVFGKIYGLSRDEIANLETGRTQIEPDLLQQIEKDNVWEARVLTLIHEYPALRIVLESLEMEMHKTALEAIKALAKQIEEKINKDSLPK